MGSQVLTLQSDHQGMGLEDRVPKEGMEKMRRPGMEPQKHDDLKIIRQFEEEKPMKTESGREAGTWRPWTQENKDDP